MANKIEIFENTLLKLLIRRGLDADRQNVVLTEGELGYTTDTKKLFIGDGQTQGGIVVGGNKFWGAVPSVTSLVGVVSGDVAFSTTNNKLYSYIGDDVTNIANWTVVGGVYNSGDNTINISGINNITVGTISAANITSDIIGNSLTLSNTNKITLSSQIAVNSVIPATGSTLTLPSSLSINNVTYNWPGAGFQNSSFLKTDILGNLTWSPVIDITTTSFVYNSAGLIPVGSIMPFVSAANAPSGWLLCNGQSVAGTSYPELSAVIGTSFGGNSTNFNVPDLVNKTLYGVAGSPAASTLYSVSSGTNSALSATGALFIIKAKPDGVLNTSMTVTSPLCATLNGSQQSGSFNPLSGALQIGLTTTLTGATTQLGPFVADQYGRVTDDPLDPAGTLYTPGPGTRPVYNGTCSPIGFFQTPAIIASGIGNSVNNYVFTISAYPYLTVFGGLCAGPPLYSVSPNAKNLIVDSIIDRQQNSSAVNTRIIASAPNTSLLAASDSNTTGITEYLVNYVKTFDINDDVSNFSQVTLPLSSTASGDLVVAFRVNDSLSSDVFNIRVLGYTL